MDKIEMPYALYENYIMENERLEAALKDANARIAALEKRLKAHQTRGNTTEARREDR